MRRLPGEAGGGEAGPLLSPALGPVSASRSPGPDTQAGWWTGRPPRPVGKALKERGLRGRDPGEPQRGAVGGRLVPKLGRPLALERPFRGAAGPSGRPPQQQGPSYLHGVGRGLMGAGGGQGGGPSPSGVPEPLLTELKMSGTLGAEQTDET